MKACSGLEEAQDTRSMKKRERKRWREEFEDGLEWKLEADGGCKDGLRTGRRES